jgi:hypothetical protein
VAHGAQEGGRGGRLRLHLYHLDSTTISQPTVLCRERWELDPSSGVSPLLPLVLSSLYTRRPHLLESRPGIGLSESMQEEQGVGGHVQHGRGEGEVEGELGVGIGALVATYGPHTEGQHTGTRTGEHQTI